MEFSCGYISPVGRIIIKADETAVTSLYFSDTEKCCGENEPLKLAKKWLDIYFSGKAPDHIPPIRPEGTDFQKLIWSLTDDIPFGKTASYGEIAAKAAQKLGKAKMSAQAVGGALGKNPVGIIIPCHRVIGADGSMTGYGFGIEKKIFLLEHEKRCIETMCRNGSRI